jgi:predicted RNA-binding Zn-ribbon protein involved in translation (DUF1610 family)
VKESLTSGADEMKPSRDVTIIFTCPNCGAAYVATQRRSSDFGSFDCRDCRTEIHRWFGDYQYDDWEQITFAPGGESGLKARDPAGTAQQVLDHSRRNA